MKSSTKKTIPAFKSKDEERAFWSRHSPLDFMERKAAVRGRFPDLRPSLESISLRPPKGMLEELKVLAH